MKYMRFVIMEVVGNAFNTSLFAKGVWMCTMPLVGIHHIGG